METSAASRRPRSSRWDQRAAKSVSGQAIMMAKKANST